MEPKGKYCSPEPYDDFVESKPANDGNPGRLVFHFYIADIFFPLVCNLYFVHHIAKLYYLFFPEHPVETMEGGSRFGDALQNIAISYAELCI
jgi:hypothetical protein